MIYLSQNLVCVIHKSAFIGTNSFLFRNSFVVLVLTATPQQTAVVFGETFVANRDVLNVIDVVDPILLTETIAFLTLLISLIFFYLFFFFKTFPRQILVLDSCCFCGILKTVRNFKFNFSSILLSRYIFPFIWHSSIFIFFYFDSMFYISQVNFSLS